MVVERLAPIIHQILSAPDTDLSTVSAKRVRKQLAELDPDITLEFIKQNKDAIDSLIGTIFESLNNPDTDADFRENPPHVSVNGNGKRKREGNGREMKAKREDSQGEDERATEEDEDQPDSPSLAIPVTKKAKKASAQALTDEEYARQLSSEINQRPSRGSRKANGSKKGASRTPKKKKSRAQIEDSDEDEEAGSRSKGPKKKSGGGAKGGFAKEYALSDSLAVVVNASQLSRPQVVKKLWEYIKSRDLQNPKNRQEILCDDAMRAVFNAEKIDMFTMNKILGQHLYEPES